VGQPRGQARLVEEHRAVAGGRAQLDPQPIEHHQPREATGAGAPRDEQLAHPAGRERRDHLVATDRGRDGVRHRGRGRAILDARVYTVARRPRQRARPPWLVAAALATAAGCGFDADYAGATITCADVDPRCPDGYQCVAGTCRTTAPPAIDAAGPDASVVRARRAAARLTTAAPPPSTSRSRPPRSSAGDTTGYANDLAPSRWLRCRLARAGPRRGLPAHAHAGDTLHAELRTTGHDGAIYLLDGCSLTATCRGGADALGAGALDQATIAITTTGTYYLVVDASSATAAGCYALRLSVTR
jgi:hypothetical protein